MALFSLIVNVLAIFIIITVKTQQIASQLIVTPRNVTNDYDIASCRVNHTMNGSLIIHGIANQMCLVQVSALPQSLQSRIKLRLDSRHNPEPHFAYVERIGTLGDCSSRVVTITHHQAGLCENVFLHRNLQINLRSNISLSVQEVLDDNSMTYQCPEDPRGSVTDAQQNQTTDCFVKGYDEVITCSPPGRYPYYCEYKFPHQCNVTLGDKEALMHCLDSDYDIQINTRRVRIIYPINMRPGLGFSHNKIIGLSDEAFHDDLFTNVQSLRLHSNQLTDLASDTFLGLPNLRKLFLSHNALESLHANLFQSQDNLLYLIRLDNNKLKTLPVQIFHGLDKLTQLNLDDNQLDMLISGVFDGLVNLKALFLYSNRLVVLGPNLFKDLAALKFLSLSNNQLTTIISLEGLRSLDNLDLSSNKLTKLNFEIFKDTRNLSRIDLAWNNLVEIPNIHDLLHVSNLNIQGNPLTMLDLDSLVTLPKSIVLYVSQHEICECYAPIDTRCIAGDSRSPYLSCDRLLSDKVLVVLMWVIGLNALGGNAFVLLWRKKKSQKNKVQDVLLCNLAVSDLLMGIYMLIIASADIYFGDYFPMRSEMWRTGITCRIAGALAILSSEASIIFVTIISIDRFISIRYPHSGKKLGVRSTIVLSVMTWIFAIALGTIPSALAGLNKFYDNSNVCIGLPLTLTELYTESDELICPNSGSCYEIKVLNSAGSVKGMYFSSAVFLGLNSICCFIILVCYVVVVRILYKSSKQAGPDMEMKEQMRLTLKVVAIVATDVCTWCPIILLGILVQARVLTLPPSAYAWCVAFVLPINSAINPYLYIIAAIRCRSKREVEHTSTTQNTAQQHAETTT